MNVSVKKGDILKEKADLLIINEFQGVSKPGGATGIVDKALDGLIVREIREKNFRGNLGELIDISTHGKIAAKRVVVVGLGEKKKFNKHSIRKAIAHVVKKYRRVGAKRVVTILHGAGAGKIKARDAAKVLVEGAVFANYRYGKYLAKENNQKKKAISDFIIVEKDGSKARQADAGVADALPAVGGTILARDLVNEPASEVTPAYLVQTAKDIAKNSGGRIRVKVLDREAAEKKGMGAFLAVAAGSTVEPYFIHLTYTPLKKSKKTVALVGKGITFDSGGLQVKPGDSMATMKIDMAGAATVLGVFHALSSLAPNCTIHGIIAATENMPGPTAYKPGDIVRAMNGKTIEIGHTDAEGRVTLADALSYAAKLKPDAIIDLATLTGACLVALGEEVAGFMSNTKKLGEKIDTAADEAGERVWELPLVDSYRDLVKGANADVKNISATKYGGAITAGLFLEEFVAKFPWIHLDIAGPAWAERDNVPYIPKGGTGFAVRTLLDFIKVY